jgi:conserved oligomeric Golgi complex subunit 4
LRLLSTGSAITVEKTAERLIVVMDKDYAGLIKKKLDDVYRTAGASGAGGTRSDKAERESRQSFIVSTIHLYAWLHVEEYQ